MLTMMTIQTYTRVAAEKRLDQATQILPSKMLQSDKGPHYRGSFLMGMRTLTVNLSIALCHMKNIVTSISSSQAVRGRQKRVRLFSGHAPMGLSIPEMGVMVLLEFATTPTELNVAAKSVTIPQQAPNTVTGCTASLDMKHLAQDTGHVGMEQPLNSFVLEAFFTMKTHTHVIGLRMLEAAKSTPCVRTTPMVTCPWASPATGTGLAREDTPAFRGVLPCSSSTRPGKDVWPPLQKTVTSHPQHPRAKMMNNRVVAEKEETTNRPPGLREQTPTNAGSLTKVAHRISDPTEPGLQDPHFPQALIFLRGLSLLTNFVFSPPPPSIYLNNTLSFELQRKKENIFFCYFAKPAVWPDVVISNLATLKQL